MSKADFQDTEQVKAVETVPIPVIIHDSAVIRYANAAAREMLHSDKDHQVVGRQLADVVRLSHPRAVQTGLSVPSEPEAAYMGIDVTFTACDGTSVSAKADGAPILIQDTRLSVMVACELPGPVV